LSPLVNYVVEVQGYLVVREFLSPDEVARLNGAIDAKRDRLTTHEGTYLGDSTTLKGEKKRGVLYGEMLTWEHPWCDPFRDLLVPPKAIPYLNVMLGRGWRLDHRPQLFYGTAGMEGLKLHGPGHQFDGAQYYVYKNSVMRCGLLSFQYQLADVNPGDGGFCCIPGSHKANFPCPPEVLEWDAAREAVVHVPLKAGDLLIFNEATTHGTLPWTADHERRSLMYRYSPKYLNFVESFYETKLPDWTDELTEAQRAALAPPHIYGHPIIEDDGETVIRPHREFP
jgi:ectoine hydroxylase-related dioxygenase (phytanoyl-CoA dioxygenase family)